MKKIFYHPKISINFIPNGIFGITVSNGIQFTGLQYSSVGNMTLISTTAPVITVILARIFLNERLNLIQIIGIIISFLVPYTY